MMFLVVQFCPIVHRTALKHKTSHWWCIAGIRQTTANPLNTNEIILVIPYGMLVLASRSEPTIPKLCERNCLLTCFASSAPHRLVVTGASMLPRQLRLVML